MEFAAGDRALHIVRCSMRTLSLSMESSRPISKSRNSTPISDSFSRSSMSFVRLQTRRDVRLRYSIDASVELTRADAG